MKLLSEACEYALRAVVWMALHPGEAHKVRDIAEHTHAAPGYLVKVMQTLAKADIVSGQRGSNGGFTLRRDPATLSVLEVINAIDPLERIRTCPLGLEGHGARLCPMHRRIDDAVAAIEKSFADSTILDMINEPTRSPALCDVLTSAASRKPNAQRKLP